MDFLLGVNYWASNAGAKTWHNFDASVVDKDFEYLSSYGVNTVRVFPSWDVFQPVCDNLCSNQTFRLRIGETPLEYSDFPNSGLSLSALENFKTLLSLAKKHELKVIVSLLTGWMSGKKFLPRVIENLNPVTDPKAVNLACRFIKDFISETKGFSQIIAWELGNECNVMSLDSDEAVNELWLSAVSNAIRVADPSRPVFAGMHGLSASGKWKLQTLGLYTDVQTTHPYPLFTPYCSKDELLSLRSSLHASAESQYYSSISKTPCLIEEIGSLGPMISSGDTDASYLEKTLALGFASGTKGYLWWCAFDQNHLDFAPYDVFAVERNLGLSNDDRTPKPALLKMKELSKFIKEVGATPSPIVDATAILSNSQDEWEIAYGSYSLGVQAGLNVDFIYENQTLPDRKNYILPSIKGVNGIPHKLLRSLIKKVEEGANLLITYDGGYMGDFEKITGLKVNGRKEKTFVKSYEGGDITVDYDLNLSEVTAKTLIYYGDNPLLTKNRLGKGLVYFLNAPLERAYTNLNSPEETNLYNFYKLALSPESPLPLNDKNLAVYRYGQGEAILINFSTANEFKLGNVKITKGVNARENGGVLVLEKPYAYIKYEDIL